MPAIVSGFLSRLRRARGILWRWRQLVSDAGLYLSHAVRGKSYLTFYAAKMDRLAKLTPDLATGRPESRQFQLDYLASHGLSRDHSMLDYGCGTVAAGVHFIEFLEPGKYVGADISSECLAVGTRRVGALGLTKKRPRLVHLADGTLSALSGEQFDVIWAQSVLTHLPPTVIEEIMRAVPAYMRAGGVFFATFASTDNGVRQKRVKDWYYAVDFFKELAERLNLSCDEMLDWRHPASEQDKLLRFTVRNR